MNEKKSIVQKIDGSTLKKFVKRLPAWLKNKLVVFSAGLEPNKRESTLH